MSLGSLSQVCRNSMLPVLKGSRAGAGEAESRRSTPDQVSGDLVNDLERQDDLAIITKARCHTRKHETITSGETACADVCRTDRKSTRLNSSHRCISYAVFCLKKKKKEKK